MAETLTELLGAAGDGRCRRLDVSQGLVRAARASGRIQGEIRARVGAAKDLYRVEADRRILPGPGDRRQEGLWRVYLHRARLGGYHDGRDERSLRLRLPVRTPEEATQHAQIPQLERCCQ